MNCRRCCLLQERDLSLLRITNNIFNRQYQQSHIHWYCDYELLGLLVHIHLVASTIIDLDVYACMCVYMCMCIHAYIHMYNSRHMGGCIYIYIHMDIYIYTYIWKKNSWIHTCPRGISIMWNANSFVKDWSQVAVSISYDDNHYAMGASMYRFSQEKISKPMVVSV